MSSLTEIQTTIVTIDPRLSINARIRALHRLGITTKRGHKFTRPSYHYYQNRPQAIANAANRAERVRVARSKGTHTQDEWREILVRAEGRCEMCRRRAKKLTKDHIEPLYLGGSDAASNLRAICRRCNSSRGTNIYADQLADQVKAARDMRGETTQQFAQHFFRSHRTIEDWEQGRRKPSMLEMERVKALIAAQIKKNKDQNKHIDNTATP